MGRHIIEVVQVLVDRIYDCGYQQRCREDDIADVYKRLTDAEGQAKHWRQARQEAHEAGELMKAEIETLQKELDATNRLASTVASERDAAHAAAMAQQHDEIASLRARLERSGRPVLHTREQLDAATEPAPVRDREREVLEGANRNTLGQLFQHAVSDAFSEINSLRQQLDAANAAVTLQRAGIERLQKCVGKVRTAILRYQPWCEALNQITAALAELDDAGNSSVTLTSSPAPVAEPIDAEGGA